MKDEMFARALMIYSKHINQLVKEGKKLRKAADIWLTKVMEFHKEMEEIYMNDLDLVIAEIEEIAKKEYDGHLTLMRFTTGWTAFYGSPDLQGSGILGDEDSEYSQIISMKTSETILDALKKLLKNNIKVEAR